jgi:hypothetical protein
MITTAGKNFVAELLTGDIPGNLVYIAVGFGTTPVTLSDTALENEQYRATASFSIASNVITYSLSVPPGSATGSITEVGIFNSSSGGTMYERIVQSPQTKAVNDTAIFTWVQTIG